jgi:NADH-ubiquinone oxidoreductase chain 5
MKGLQLGYYISKIIDRGIIELVGPYGLSNSLINTGKNIAKLDTGIITTYGLYIILGLIILILVVFFPLLFENILVEPRVVIILFLSLLIQPFTIGNSSFSNFNYNQKQN